MKKSQEENGKWGYKSGSSGEVQIGAGVAVLGIACQQDPAVTGGAAMQINGGDIIPVHGAVSITPEGILVGPQIIFAGTISYFIETVS